MMLKEYSEAIDSLTDIEKILLKSSISDLNKCLEPGHESLNLSSLCIPDFIKNCQEAISKFRDTKKKVEKSASTIDEFIQKIE